jgi:predicted nucleotide-binding protein
MESNPQRVRANSRQAFVVHGHDEGARESVARFLEKVDLKPIILHERPSKGRTLITKFREESADIGFAIVLMTPDDRGAEVGEPATRQRSRQNVVFEPGFFIGRLGPERVAALVKGNIERPSDFDGVVYIDLDDAGGWRQQLGRELGAAGYEIDWNKVMRP